MLNCSGGVVFCNFHVINKEEIATKTNKRVMQNQRKPEKKPTLFEQFQILIKKS